MDRQTPWRRGRCRDRSASLHGKKKRKSVVPTGRCCGQSGDDFEDGFVDCRVPHGPPQVAAASVPLGTVSGMPRARNRSAVSRETLDRKCLGDVSCRALDHSLTHDTRLFTPRGVNTLPAHSAAAEASRRNATSARATRKVPKEELSEKVNGCVAAWSERLLERLGGAGRRQIVIV